MIYNLIINPNTREWERQKLIETKNKLKNDRLFWSEIENLEAVLRPLAIRNNLTPDVSDFYLKITDDSNDVKNFDWSKHKITDLNYQEQAVFAGGCFWCMVQPFETKPGILSVLSGYTGGHIPNPSYDQVSSGTTGHVEAVEIIFDKRIISYEELVTLYLQLTDPTDSFGQFQDRGDQYRPIIFVQNEAQRQIAEKSKKELQESGRYSQPIVTEIKKAITFWPAENYHQQFYKKQPKRYKRIKHQRQQLLNYQRLMNKLQRTFRRG
ncbi:peptide-methionine (S)-S-oxide reductase MsrA [Enterococcus mediterraneensis]|uniref:peptide-methionine (S)-S-oxide reductase MsrA n=1 Tax=Enterococcus mediterraneensis TaxID=2364791 RepID=UPI0019CF62C3|nr:peptide-methionine (S)-S-oxide reductase MsrA [Enterococcus mediterraneensis]